MRVSSMNDLINKSSVEVREAIAECTSDYEFRLAHLREFLKQKIAEESGNGKK